jgi:hypothetical protein
MGVHKKNKIKIFKIKYFIHSDLVIVFNVLDKAQQLAIIHKINLVQWKPLEVIKFTLFIRLQITFLCSSFDNCYHLLNVISFSLSQSDHVKWLQLYCKTLYSIAELGLVRLSLIIGVMDSIFSENDC